MSKAKQEKTKVEKETSGSAIKPFFAPKIEDSVSLSKDGKWIISKVTITSIKPVKYFEKVLGAHEPEMPNDAESGSSEPQG